MEMNDLNRSHEVREMLQHISAQTREMNETTKRLHEQTRRLIDAYQHALWRISELEVVVQAVANSSIHTTEIYGVDDEPMLYWPASLGYAVWLKQAATALLREADEEGANGNATPPAE